MSNSRDGLSYSTTESNSEKKQDPLDFNKVQDVEVAEIQSFQDEETTESVFGEDRHRLKQGLQQRHLQMLTLCSVLGTGLFLSSGGTLATTGPCGLFLAYFIVAIVVGMNQMAMAECASLMPTSAATVRHLEQFIDPAWGFAYGWIGVWSSIMPNEISAAAMIVSYWSDLSQGIWITIMIVIIYATNMYSIRFYGELEFTFAIIKLSLLVGLIIVSVVITCGGGPDHTSIGFRYWRDPGPFVQYLGIPGSLGRFAGFWKALSSVVYAYGGIQSIPSLAAEVQYPRRTVFTACKRIFYRVSFLMVIASFCLTLIVPSNDKTIASSSGNAESSPFVVAIKNANIKVLPHIINAGVLTSAFSAANVQLVYGSRNLFALAVKNQAPKIFLKTTNRGIPWVGTTFCACFMPLAYMNLSQGSANVFSWFQSIVSAKLLFSWILISANHIHMSRAMKAQGIPRSRLPHTLRFAPQAAWISGILSFVFLLTGGFKNFIKGEFLISSLFSSYFILPLAFFLYFFWKFFKKTRYWRPHEVQLEALFKDAEENPEPPLEKVRGWKILTLLWS